MAEHAYPFDAGAGAALSEDDWTKMARLFAGPGVVGDPGAIALQVFADSSGMLVFVRPGSAMVRGHYYNLDAQKSISIPANGAGSARVDRIVLRLDPSANGITAERVAGVAGSGAPALTQTDTGIWELPLAKIAVDPGAVNIPGSAVTDDRLFAGLDLLPCLNVGQITTPRIGQTVYEVSTGLLKLWNGSSWLEGVLRTAAQTLTNKTLTSPTINGPLAGTAWDKVVKAGTSPLPAEVLACGSAVAVTDAGGRIAIAVPASIAVVHSCVAVGGDVDADGPIIAVVSPSDGNGKTTFRIFTAGGAVMASASVRLNWIMTGEAA